MKKYFSITLLFFIVAITSFISCAPRPYFASDKIYKQKVKQFAKELRKVPVHNGADSALVTKWVGSVNFNLRKPNYVILHYTAQKNCEQTIKTFTTDSTQVSSHYLICRDGIVHQMLNDYLRGWHAGLGKWGNNTDINSSSIGIEIDNNGSDSFTEAQLNKLEVLLKALQQKYNIPAANFLGHSDVAPGRKVDPGALFPWKRLADAGFGTWYQDTTNLVVPADFSVPIALRIVGYDVSKTDAAIHSFRLHFCPSLLKAELSDGEKKILYSLMLQAMD